MENTAMTETRETVEHLVMRIQNDYLDHPLLALTLGDAQERFGIDEVTCEAVLAALVDADVLTRRNGKYRMNRGRHGAARAA
jgi:hypothetical protein